MIIVRDVFQAKYGKGGELVALFKEARPELFPEHGFRVLTDASGPFFTVVTEVEVASLGEWEKIIQQAFLTQSSASGSPAWSRWCDPGSASFTTWRCKRVTLVRVYSAEPAVISEQASCRRWTRDFDERTSRS